MTTPILAEKIARLEDIARQLRLLTMEIAWKLGARRKSHAGPALSIADIVAALYFDVMRIDPRRTDWPARDRLILSKGHACPVLYAALALRGYFDREHLFTLRHVNSILQGHPDMRKTPGVDMTAGSLGNGLGAGVGMAIAGKLIDRLDYKVHVIVGDGECNEGLIWESAMAAGKFNLNNLIALIDCNGWQSCGTIEEIMPMGSLSEKWRAFGWNIIEIDGHDMAQILEALEAAGRNENGPTAIMARTIKGKGVSFMENDNLWHLHYPTDEQWRIAREELEAGR